MHFNPQQKTNLVSFLRTKSNEWKLFLLTTHVKTKGLPANMYSSRRRIAKLLQVYTFM